VALAAGIFSQLTKGVEFGSDFIDKYSSAQSFVAGSTTSGRVATIRDGLLMLAPVQWISGAGLTSVMDSGPHNDYVRWAQRVGIPLMMFGFMPFILAFRHSWRQRALDPSNSVLHVFLAMAVGFTLVHSLFGYPREDANQAVAVYLSLALWCGAFSEGLFKALPPGKAAGPSSVHFPEARLPE
jgi:hypothetical protein